MEVALGVLRWPPGTFWEATYLELSCAYAGHAKARGLGAWRPASGRVGAPWRPGEVERLRQQMAELKRRFPDGPRGGRAR